MIQLSVVASSNRIKPTLDGRMHSCIAMTKGSQAWTMVSTSRPRRRSRARRQQASYSSGRVLHQIDVLDVLRRTGRR